MKFILCVFVMAALTACGTVSGIGKDITGTADWTKEKISGKK